MNSEVGRWNDLARLWLTGREPVSSVEVKERARRQRLQMVALATAEAVMLVLAFLAAIWIAVHTAFVPMSVISVVFFATCGYLQHRMRREPPPAGGEDLLASLSVRIEHEQWVLAQLGVGRAVTLVTFAALALLDAHHLRYFAGTPADRLWALLGITVLVLAILAWNMALSRKARCRCRQLASYAQRVRGGPESRHGVTA